MRSRMIIFLITTISLIGCTSMRTMDAQQADLTEQLEAGDHLVVYEKSGRKVDMTLSEIDDGILYGSQFQNGLDTVEVEISEIVRIEIEKISGVKTTGAVLGIIVLLPFVALGAVFMGADY